MELSKVDTLENWHLLDTLVELSKVDTLEKLVVVNQKNSCVTTLLHTLLHTITLLHYYTHYYHKPLNTGELCWQFKV